jgi:hypothetical protein
MKLPNWQRGVIEQAKLITYLLSPLHPLGSHKAAFFWRFGFSVDEWYKLLKHLSTMPGSTTWPRLKTLRLVGVILLKAGFRRPMGGLRRYARYGLSTLIRISQGS